MDQSTKPNAGLLIPHAERAPGLKPLLLNQAKIIAKIVKSQRANALTESSPLLALVHPWIPSEDASQLEALALRRTEHLELGFDGSVVRDALDEILSADKHLRECCVNSPTLARCIDLNFMRQALEIIDLGIPENGINDLYESFAKKIYEQGRFCSVTFAHLFNFSCDLTSCSFDGEIRIERLNRFDIPKIIGETSFVSFIQPPGTGDYFIVSERAGPCVEDIDWLMRAKQNAHLFTNVLQYFKCNVVCIDYAVLHFMPL